MTNLEKMNELVGTNADKYQIGNWAYMNRILVEFLYHEPEFVSMENTVDYFMKNIADDFDDEHKLWDKFLDTEYVE